MKQKIKKFFQEIGVFSLSLSIAFVLTMGVAVVKGWTKPTQAPPNGNLGAPLNTGAIGQTKAGGLILNTGGAANGLIVDKGNVGIGTQYPNAAKGQNGNVDANDVYLRSIGKWASEIGSGSGIYKRAATNYCGGTAFFAHIGNRTINGDNFYLPGTTSAGWDIELYWNSTRWCGAVYNTNACAININPIDWVLCTQ